MKNLENEIKEAFETEQIDITSNDILKNSEVSFVSKKPRIINKGGFVLGAVNIAVAASVLGLTLALPLTYIESVYDSIENYNFASHIVGSLGLARLAIENNTIDSINLDDNYINDHALPTIAFLNYTYTNKDRIDYSFENTEKELNNEKFNIKETIKDNFLNKDYDILFKKKDLNSFKAYLFSKNSVFNASEPIMEINIGGKVVDRSCLLNISLNPTTLPYKDYAINVTENKDSSIDFSFKYQQENIFNCNFLNKDGYNQFILTRKGLNNKLIFKVFDKGSMNYECSYNEENVDDKPIICTYTFNEEGEIETLEKIFKNI